MINTTKLQTVVSEYDKKCIELNIKPTHRGLGNELGITGQTVRNIVTGIYKDGKPYTTTPHITRCIDNEDFSIVRDLFI